MDKRYADQVALLVAILPLLDAEPRFALKGGTAINLFEHDLPRLSVDIDLTWLPMQDFDTDATQIAEPLTLLAGRLSAPPLRLNVRESGAEGARAINRLIASRIRTQVKIETTPVMRGTVHPIRRMDLRPSVEREFGSAQVQVLDFADGKAQLVLTVAKTLTNRFKAGELIRPIAAIVGGTGGGRPDMAQAGGTEVSKLEQAIEAVYEGLEAS